MSSTVRFGGEENVPMPSSTGIASKAIAHTFGVMSGNSATFRSPLSAKPPTLPGPLNAGGMSLFASPKAAVKNFVATSLETEYVDRKTASRTAVAAPQPQGRVSKITAPAAPIVPTAEVGTAEVPIDISVPSAAIAAGNSSSDDQDKAISLTAGDVATVIASLPAMPVLEVSITLPSPEPLAPVESMNYRDICREIAAVLTQREAETNAAMLVLEKQQQLQQHQGYTDQHVDAAAGFLSPTANGKAPSASSPGAGVRVVGTLRVQSYAAAGADAKAGASKQPITADAIAASLSPITADASGEDGDFGSLTGEEETLRALNLIDDNKSAFRFRRGGVAISARAIASAPASVSTAGTSSSSAVKPAATQAAPTPTCHVVLSVRVPDSLPGVVRAFCVPKLGVQVAELMEGPMPAVDAITAVKTLLGAAFSQGMADYVKTSSSASKRSSTLSPMTHVMAALKHSLMGSDSSKDATSPLLQAACRVYPHAHLTPAESEVRVQALILKVRATNRYFITPPLAPLVQTRLGSSHVTDSDKKAVAASKASSTASASTSSSNVPATPTSRGAPRTGAAASAIGTAIGQAISASIVAAGATASSSSRVPASPAARAFAASTAAVLASGGGKITAPRTPGITSSGNGQFASDPAMLPLLATTLGTPLQLSSKTSSGDFSLKSIPAIDVDGTSRHILMQSASKHRHGNSKHGGTTTGAALTFTFSAAGNGGLVMTPGSAKRASSRFATSGSAAGKPQHVPVNRPGMAASFMSPLAAAAGLSASHLQQKMMMAGAAGGFKSPVASASSSSSIVNHPIVASNPLFASAPLPYAVVRYTSLLDESRTNGAEPASFDREYHRGVLLTMQKGLESMSGQRRAEEEHMRLATRVKPAKHPRGGYLYTDVDNGFGVNPRDYERSYMAEVHYAKDYVDTSTVMAWQDEHRARVELMAAWTPERVAEEEARIAADKAAKTSWWDQEVDEDVDAGNAIDLNAAVLKAAAEAQQKSAAASAGGKPKAATTPAIDDDFDIDIIDVVVEETFGPAAHQAAPASAGAFLHALIHSVARTAAHERERAFSQGIESMKASKAQQMHMQVMAMQQQAQAQAQAEAAKKQEKAKAQSGIVVQIPFEPLSCLVGGSTALLQLRASLDCLLDAAVVNTGKGKQQGDDIAALKALYAGVAKAAVAYAAFKGVSVEGVPAMLESSDESFVSSGAAALFRDFEAGAEVDGVPSFSPSSAEKAMMMEHGNTSGDANAIRYLLGLEAGEGSDGACGAVEQQDAEPEAVQVLRDAVTSAGFAEPGPFSGIALQAAAMPGDDGDIDAIAASQHHQLATAVMILAGAGMETADAAASAEGAAAEESVLSGGLSSDEHNSSSATLSSTASSVATVGALVRSLNFDTAAPCSPILNGAATEPASSNASTIVAFSLDAPATTTMSEAVEGHEREQSDEPTFSELLGSVSSAAAGIGGAVVGSVEPFSFSMSARRVLESMEEQAPTAATIAPAPFSAAPAVGGSPAEGQRGYFSAMAAAALTTELQEAGLLLPAASSVGAPIPASSPLTATATFSSFVSHSQASKPSPSSLVDFFAPSSEENGASSNAAANDGFEDASAVFGEVVKPSAAAPATSFSGRPSFKLIPASAGSAGGVVLGRKSGLVTNVAGRPSVASFGAKPEARAAPAPPMVPGRFSLGGLASIFGVTLPAASSGSNAGKGQ